MVPLFAKTGGHIMKNKSPLRRAHHEGSIRQRPDGRWEVRFTIPASDGEKARRKSYYCHTKQEAVQILRGQWDPQWNLGPNGTTLLTVGEWLEIWLEHKELSLKPSTLRHYKSVIRCHLKPLFRRRIYQLSLTYIEAFYREKLHGDVSSGMLLAFHKILHQALRYAVKEGILLSNPAAGADLPTRPVYTANVFSRSQQLQLIESTEMIPHGICIRLALGTGLRIGEIVALQWGDIDLSERVLKVRRTQGERAEETLSPKTNNSHRAIPLTQNTAENLAAWFKKMEPATLATPVFPDEDGGYLSARKLRAEYKQLLEMLHLPSYSFHTLRHTFATRALVVGMDYKTLSVLLGHSSVTFTLDVYAHCSDTHKRREMARMEYEYQEIPEELMLSRYERYRRQVEACPEVMTKEQFRIACHISKRKAKELLDNGIVPCEITGNKTWKYRIKKSDVLDYLERVRGVKFFYYSKNLCSYQIEP